jgi:hypothetical protein
MPWHALAFLQVNFSQRFLAPEIQLIAQSTLRQLSVQ